MLYSSTQPPVLSRSTLHPNTVVWLDFLRFFCAVIVVCDHVFGWCPCNTNGPAPGPIANVMFFILSGFLIVHSIHNKITKPNYNFISFFIDRFSRIYPAYLAALVFIAIIDSLSNYYFLMDKPIDNLSTGSFFINLFMLHKIPFHYDFSYTELSPVFKIFPIYGSASQLWSIPPEWWMYMFVGYAVFSVRWKKVTWWRVLLLCLLAYVPTNFLFLGNVYTGIGVTAVWLFGALACVLYRHINIDLSNRAHVILLMLGLVIFSFAAFMRYFLTLNAFDMLGAFSLSGIFYCCLWISKMSFMSFLTHPRVKALCMFGAGYSFSLYLTHYSLDVFLKTTMSPYIIFIICHLFAIGFAHLFERRHKDLAHYLRACVQSKSKMVA